MSAANSVVSRDVAVAGPQGRIARLDVLRGVAVALVMLRHAWPDAFPGAGIVGVVMFFTLSGYLITTSLRQEWEGRGRVDFAHFYWRRAARLVPALLLLVAGFTIVTLWWDPLGDRDEVARTVVVALTWTSNVPTLVNGGAMFHLWTLALEEQFYLVWPAVLIAALTRRRIALVVAGGAVLCLVLACATVLVFRDAPDLAYPLPTPWAVALVMGASIAVLPRLRAGVMASTPAVVAACMVLSALAFMPLRGNPLTYVLVAPAVAAATMVLIVRARADVTSLPPLGRALAALGVISYSAYLWNYPLTLWLRPALGGWSGQVALALTVLVAWASYRVVEEPARMALLRWSARVRARKGGIAHGD